jgi:hypothetical protein
VSKGSEQARSWTPIEIELNRRDLPPHVGAARGRHERWDAELRKIAEPRARAHIDTCREVAKDLQRWHRLIADQTDLDLVGRTRGSAIWLIAGRCLGLHEVLLVQAENEIDQEIQVTGRTLHEACELLVVLANSREEELLRIWLDDDGKHRYAKPSNVRAARDRYESELADAMAQAGLSSAGPSGPLNAELYDILSRAAHNRRSSCVSSLWQDGRQMAYGRAHNALRWAETVDWVSRNTANVVHAVGDALSTFYGVKVFTPTILALEQRVNSIRQAYPLDRTSLHHAMYPFSRP